MLDKLGCGLLVAALVSTLVATPGLASAQAKRDTNQQSKVITQERELFVEDVPANQALRADISKLVAGVKAQRDVVTFPRPQLQSPQRNNLSKGTKITIGVAVAVAVVVVVLVAQRCSNEPGGC
ncbi:MAG TPA: hypothetical protein VJ124_22565 [Pyrinomonadaceae bacterium]|nr:hypothetical protein [Pyrinomonadaceae bacterium]